MGGFRLFLSLVILLSVGAAPAHPPRFRVFSREKITLAAKVNGIGGHLTLARFHCPLALHVATCGLTFLVGDPVVLNVLAHAGLKAMERMSWAEFYPLEMDEVGRELKRVLSLPAADDVHRRVQLEIDQHRERAEKWAGGEVELRGGQIEIQAEPHYEKVFQYTPSLYYPGENERTASYVGSFLAEPRSADLIFVDRSGRFLATHRRGDERAEREVSPGCADLLLLSRAG